MLDGLDALNGDVEALGESNVSVQMATRHVDPTEECLGDLPGYIVVAGCERNTRFNAGRDEFR